MTQCQESVTQCQAGYSTVCKVYIPAGFSDTVLGVGDSAPGVSAVVLGVGDAVSGEVLHRV